MKYEVLFRADDERWCVVEWCAYPVTRSEHVDHGDAKQECNMANAEAMLDEWVKTCSIREIAESLAKNADVASIEAMLHVSFLEGAYRAMEASE